jgi:hypothetical protein
MRAMEIWCEYACGEMGKRLLSGGWKSKQSNGGAETRVHKRNVSSDTHEHDHGVIDHPLAHRGSPGGIKVREGNVNATNRPETTNGADAHTCDGASVNKIVRALQMRGAHVGDNQKNGDDTERCLGNSVAFVNSAAGSGKGRAAASGTRSPISGGRDRGIAYARGKRVARIRVCAFSRLGKAMLKWKSLVWPVRPPLRVCTHLRQ